MRISSVLKHCSVERLSRLAIQQLELTTQERNLDQFFELLKANRFDEHTNLDSLTRLFNNFQVREEAFTTPPIITLSRSYD